MVQVSQAPVVQEAKPAGPLTVGPNAYGAFVKQSANRVISCVPDENLSFHLDKENATMHDNFCFRVVALPSGRTFVIGGSKDVHGAQAVKTTQELVNGKLEDRC